MLDLQNRFDLIADILRSSSDCIKVLDLDANLVFMSEGGQRVMEIDDIDRFIGCPWPDFWQDEGNAAAKSAVAEARAGRHTSFQGMARTGKGRERWWDVAVNPVFDGEGAVASILSISRDITDLKAAEAQQRLLMEELTHRVRNSLTMIKAIAAQTFRDVPDRTPVEAFNARLMALAASHDLLMQESWSHASIKAVVGSSLKLHANEARIEISGPDVVLGPKTSLHLTLLLHELGTNATKYGALSGPAGRVGVTWGVTGGAPGSLALKWREEGGPTVVEPSRKGFGSRLIKMGLGDGQAELEFRPTGFAASFETPMSLAAL